MRQDKFRELRFIQLHGNHVIFGLFRLFFVSFHGWEASAFTDAVQRLAEEKRAQCSQQQAKLQTAIDALNTNAAESLTYFEMTAYRFWRADAVAVSNAETATSLVVELHSALERHAHLRTQKAATRLADRTRLDEMSRLEEQILLLYQRLHEMFAPIEGEDENAVLPGSDDTFVEAQSDFAEEEQRISTRVNDSAVGALENEVPDSPPGEFSAVSAAAFVAGNEASEQKAFVVSEDDHTARVGVDEADEPPFAAPVELQVESFAATADGEVSTWDDLLWTLLEKNDPGAAYWLSYALTAAGRDCTVSERLLAVLCGAALLPFDSHLLAGDLAEIARTYSGAQADAAQAVLEISAALRPALIAPNVGLQKWLHKTHLSPSLNKLTAAMSEFAGSGNPLPLPAVAPAPDAQLTEASAKLAAEALQWLSDAPARRNPNKGANDVWRMLTRAQGEFGQLLDSVSRNQRQRKDQVLAVVRQWEDRDWLPRRINELHADTVLGKKVQPITGMPLQQLMRDIKEGCQIAGRWCAAVTREDNAQSDWLSAQTIRLRALAHEVLPMAEAELREAFRSQETDRSLTGAVHYLLHTLQDLRSLFQLTPTKSKDSATGLCNSQRR